MKPKDTQACVKRNIEAERKELPDVIYLVSESGGGFGDYWAWCDEAAPTDEHVAEEAVKYVRADK